MPPLFEIFLLDTLNSEQKLSVKKRLTGPVRNRSTGVDFLIYQSDRVEKILTGSITLLSRTSQNSASLYILFQLPYGSD